MEFLLKVIHKHILQIVKGLYLIPLYVIWIIIFCKYWKQIQSRILLLKRVLIKRIKNANKIKKGIFIPIGAIGILLLFYSLQLPLSYDEAFTFNHFTLKGLVYSLCTYPVPNNQVLYSLFTNVSWDCLAFTHSAIAVRIPAIIFSILSIYFVSTRYLNQNFYPILAFSILYLFSPNIIEYAFQARGYSLQMFFGIITYYLASKKDIKHLLFRDRAILVLLLSILGVFTSPAYLYTAVVIYLIFITQFYSEVKRHLIFFILISVFFALTGILLYSPIIVFEGIKSLTSNKFVRPVGNFNILSVLTHLIQLFNYLTLPIYLGWGIFLLFIIYSVRRKAYYNFYFIVIPFVMMFILKQLPFFRVFLPFSLIIIVNACLKIFESSYYKHIASLSQFKSKLLSYLLFLCIAMSSYFYFTYLHKKGDLNSSYQFKKVTPYLVKYNLVYIYHLDWYMNEPLQAYLKIKKLHPSIGLQNDSSINIFHSAVILSSNILHNIAVADSLNSLNDKKVWVYLINKHS
jgi:hypothetical protein